MSKIKHVVWDWNGTLIDDIDVCVKSINQVLRNHNYQELKNNDEYKSKFCFPIEQYYANLGFDFNKTPFISVASEYIDIYQPLSK